MRNGKRLGCLDDIGFYRGICGLLEANLWILSHSLALNVAGFENFSHTHMLDDEKPSTSDVMICGVLTAFVT